MKRLEKIDSGNNKEVRPAKTKRKIDRVRDSAALITIW